MSQTLDYGRSPSRRRQLWVLGRTLALGLLLAWAALVGVRAWRLHLALLEDRRLQAEQRKYREDFDRQLQRQLSQPSTRPAATRP